jgi:hypothetical protein
MQLIFFEVFQLFKNFKIWIRLVIERKNKNTKSTLPRREGKNTLFFQILKHLFFPRISSQLLSKSSTKIKVFFSIFEEFNFLRGFKIWIRLVIERNLNIKKYKLFTNDAQNTFSVPMFLHLFPDVIHLSNT